MADQAVRRELDKTDPNKTFEELLKSKMERKNMTREEAVVDILSTATKTRKSVNKKRIGVMNMFEYSICNNAHWNCQEMCSWRIPKIMDRQESGGVMRELL